MVGLEPFSALRPCAMFCFTDFSLHVGIAYGAAVGQMGLSKARTLHESARLPCRFHLPDFIM